MTMPTTEARGTAPERWLVTALRRLGVEPDEYERAPSDVAGRPDFFFRQVVPRQVAVFVDGCAYHGCPVHYRPATDDPKHGLAADAIARQKVRDKTVRAALAASGYRVIAFWEHDVMVKPETCAAQIVQAVRG